jgi:two-component system, chemotaxis family, protein-glutamate methylesterase/glutaminase
MDRQAVLVTAPGDAAVVQEVAPRCDLQVVAIGASAGGVAALPTVLAALPDDFPAAVIVVQHLDPHFRSYLASVLARTCRLPVREAVSGEVIRSGIVYVAPRAAHLVLRGGGLVLTDAAPVHFVRPSVDVLFTSVAAACETRAIGIILTGAGVDGATGLEAIKRAGGRTIVEDPLTAQHSGMPTAACATGCADATLPLTMIGPALVELVRSHQASLAEKGDG